MDVAPQLLRAARPLPAQRQAVIPLAGTSPTLLGPFRVLNTWLILSFSSFLSKGKRENLYPVIAKQDLRTYDALQVRPYHTGRLLPLSTLLVSAKGHFFSLPFVRYGQGKEIGPVGYLL